MSDRPSGLGRWILLGRALPARTRERVFEPAFYDLLRRSLRSQDRSSLRFGGQAFGILAGSFAIAVRRVVFSQRFIAISVILIVIATAVTLLQDWLQHLYAASSGY
jgi:hypothetical protein